jgi:CelD/BcsL family acetyltransferase involved in cellulose biosynthesis
MIDTIAWSELSRVESLLAEGSHAEGLPGWFEALAETTLDAGERAAIVVSRAGGAPKAALPVAIGPSGIRGLTAPYTTRYAPPLPDVDSAYEMGRQMRGVAGGAVRLDAIDRSDPGMAAFLKGLGENFATASYQGFVNWSEPVADFAGYWARRPSRLRTTVRRKSAAAAATFTYLRDGFGPALAHYEAIQRASWKGPEPHPAFLATMVQRLAPAVRMGLLEIEGRMVAAQIWLVHGGRATIFKLVHREDAAALSPGTLLTHRMIETCLREEGVSMLDFGRGDDTYKRDWMGVCTTRIGVIAADWRYGNGLRTLAADVLPTLAGRAWRRHFGPNRAGSVATPEGDALEGTRDQGRVVAAEAF